jgi:tetratricopeptide (TPR) repeat protein
MKNIVVTVTFLLIYSCTWAQSAGKEPYEKAIAYMNKGNTRQGFAYLNQSLAADPSFYDALYARGYYLFSQADYEKATVDFDSLLTHYPQDTASYRYRGLSQMYLKNFQEAEKDLLTALSLDSTDHSIYSDLGYFYYQLMEYEAARHYLDESIRIRPSRFALYQKAQTHYSLNEFNETLTALAPLLKEDPKDADALRLQALVYLNTKKYPESIKIYEQLLANGDISEPDDFLNWGLTHYMQKKYTQALIYFNTPKKHTDSELYYYTGLTYYKLKDNKKALKALNKAVLYMEEAGQEQAPVFYDRAIVRSAMKDNSGATQDYLQAVALLPEITRQRNQFGDTLALLGNAAVLLKGLYSPKQIDSVSAIGYWQRAENLFERDGLEEEALQAVNYSVQLAPDKEQSLFTRAKIYYFYENYPKALQDVNKAIELNNQQNNADYFHLRGLVYYQMENPQKARQDFDKAIALEPENASYYYERAFAWADTGKYAEALTDMNKAMSLDTETSVPYLMARADFYNQLGQFDKALADCEAIILKSHDQAIVYYQRGLARFGLKDYSGAITDFTRAIQLEPDFTDARQKLQEALQAN